MASNYTSNYGLCQWEATDQVLRAEFNENNAMIDGELGKKLGTVQLIKTVEPPTATKFSLDLTDIDWTQWNMVGCTMDLMSAINVEPATVSFTAKTANGNVGGECSSSRNSFAEIPFMPFVLVFLPLRDSRRRVRCLYLGGNSGTGTAECTFQELTELSLYTGSTYFHPSYVLTLWGIP